MKQTWHKSALAALFLAVAGMFATEADAATQWETVDGKARLVVRLRYVCSSWLYLRFLNRDQARDYREVHSTNERKCAEFAAIATADAQAAFDRSDLPVRFVSSSEIEPDSYDNLKFGSIYDGGHTLASRVAAANKGRMPGLTIDRITGLYYYVNCGQVCLGFWASSTVYVAPADYTLSDPFMTELLDWAESNPRYMPPTGELSVTILVRPIAAPNQRAAGIVKAIVDWRSKISGETLQPINDLTPDNYLRQTGVIAVLFDNPRGTVAHELGHVFGALHERASWSTTDSYFQSAGFLDASGTQVRPGGAYSYFDISGPARRDLPHSLTCVNTIMNSSKVCSVPDEVRKKFPRLTVAETRQSRSFSSPHHLLPEYPKPVGSAMADNRLVIAETLKFLGGGKCFPGATLSPLACQ